MPNHCPSDFPLLSSPDLYAAASRAGLQKDWCQSEGMEKFVRALLRYWPAPATHVQCTLDVALLASVEVEGSFPETPAPRAEIQQYRDAACARGSQATKAQLERCLQTLDIAGKIALERALSEPSPIPMSKPQWGQWLAQHRSPALSAWLREQEMQGALRSSPLAPRPRI